MKKGSIIFVIEVYLSGINQQRKYQQIILQWLEIKKEKDYVFDVSAHQFENRGMSNLNGPLILSADEWVCKYRMATRRKLIYYTDFSNSSIAANAYDALPRELESESMAGKVLLHHRDGLIPLKAKIFLNR